MRNKPVGSFTLFQGQRRDMNGIRRRTVFPSCDFRLKIRFHSRIVTFSANVYDSTFPNIVG
jgi:hypothetical protein